jgi:hypothetical protein
LDVLADFVTGTPPGLGARFAHLGFHSCASTPNITA